MKLTDEQLEELEMKYFEEIVSIFKKHQDYIQKRLQSRDRFRDDWADKIKEDIRKQPVVRVGTERITETLLARKTSWEVSSIPVGSDLCYETEDAIVHIDDKSLFKTDPDVSLRRVAVREVQTSYQPPNPIRGKRGKRKGTVMHFEPALPQYYNGEIPCLTYFVQFVYDEKVGEVIEIVLWAVPNGQLSKYYGDIFEAPKTYDGGTPRVIMEKVETARLVKDWKRVVRISLQVPGSKVKQKTLGIL